MIRKIFKRAAVSGLIAAMLILSAAQVLAAGLTPEEQEKHGGSVGLWFVPVYG